jgi:hypothetical protein
MLGTYRVSVLVDKVIRYEFTLKRQFTVVCGDSGTGKTVLRDFIQMHFTEKDNDRVKIVITPEFNASSVPVARAITEDLLSVRESGDTHDDGSYKLKWSKKPRNKIIFVDEDYAYLRGIGFAAATNYTDAYYVVLTRDTRVTEYLNNSVWDFIRFKEVGDETIVNKSFKMYNEYNGAIENYDEVLHEDSTTGKEICAKAISEVIESVHGNINIVRSIETRPNSTILLVADGANFSNILSEIVDTSEECLNTVYLLLPESTEYVLLHNRIFDTDSDAVNSIQNPSLVCDTTKYISYEKMYEDIIALAHINNPDKIPEYKKERDLETYKTESFIDTYRAILTRIDGIKSSYNIKYSLYKIENGELITGDLRSPKISKLNEENEK